MHITVTGCNVTLAYSRPSRCKTTTPVRIGSGLQEHAAYNPHPRHFAVIDNLGFVIMTNRNLFLPPFPIPKQL